MPQLFMALELEVVLVELEIAAGNTAGGTRLLHLSMPRAKPTWSYNPRELSRLGHQDGRLVHSGKMSWTKAGESTRMVAENRLMMLLCLLKASKVCRGHLACIHTAPCTPLEYTCICSQYCFSLSFPTAKRTLEMIGIDHTNAVYP